MSKRRDKMNAEELSGLGKIRKEVEPFKDLKVTYHSLSLGEEEAVNAAMASAPQDLVARTTALQRETLIQTIEKIGDKTFTDVAELRKYVLGLQRHVVTQLYSAWNDSFDQPSLKTVEDLKKNSEQPKPDSSGSTAEPLVSAPSN